MPKRRRWLWPTESSRGKLKAVEELDIAHAPRPEKTDQELTAETAGRLSRADSQSPPDLYPMAISSAPGGLPTFREDMLRRLDGATALSQTEQRWQLRLATLEQTNPIYYHMLVWRYVDHRSDRDIARSIGLSDKTVGSLITRAELLLLADYQALFGVPIQQRKSS